MSGFHIVTTTKTYCSHCGRELRSADDWAICKRQHSLEYHASTPEGRTMLEMLKGMALQDKPDERFRTS